MTFNEFKWYFSNFLVWIRLKIPPSFGFFLLSVQNNKFINEKHTSIVILHRHSLIRPWSNLYSDPHLRVTAWKHEEKIEIVNFGRAVERLVLLVPRHKAFNRVGSLLWITSSDTYVIGRRAIFFHQMQNAVAATMIFYSKVYVLGLQYFYK